MERAIKMRGHITSGVTNVRERARARVCNNIVLINARKGEREREYRYARARGVIVFSKVCVQRLCSTGNLMNRLSIKALFKSVH